MSSSIKEQYIKYLRNKLWHVIDFYIFDLTLFEFLPDDFSESFV